MFGDSEAAKPAENDLETWTLLATVSLFSPFEQDTVLCLERAKWAQRGK